MAKKNANTGKAITERLYYITNQYNLREILSGGFIGPRNSFDDKYYNDLLIVCAAGRIPFFTAPLASALFETVRAEDPETSIAVALEIDPAKLETGFCEEIKTGGKDDGSRLAAIVCSGVISLRSVQAIHFLSAEDHKEFVARSYSNMSAPRELYKISPQLAAASGDVPEIMEKIKLLPGLEFPAKLDFSSLDKISGAVSLCIFRSEGKNQSQQLLKLLEPGRKPKKTADIPAWFELGLDKKTTEVIHQLTDINELVFASTISVLHSYDLDSVGNREKILEQIKKIVYTHPAIEEEHRMTLDRSFTKIQRLLRLEDVFEPFKPSPTGFDAIRGLLLFLMRPKHRDLLSWNQAETNAAQSVILTALAYSGIVVGRKSLDMEYRPADKEIAELVVAALNQLTKQNRSAKPGSKIKTKSEKSQPAAMAQSSFIATGQLVETNSMDLETIKTGISDGKKEDPAFIAAAIRLCRENGWNDCVTTVVEWSGRDTFLLQPGQKNQLTLKVSGFPEISYELHFDRFIVKIFPSSENLPENPAVS